MKKAEFIERWLPLPAKYSGQCDEFKSDLDELLKAEAVEFNHYVMLNFFDWVDRQSLRPTHELYNEWQQSKNQQQ